MIEEIKKDIVKFSRLLYQRKLVGAAGGNVSARYKDKFLITAGGKSLREIGEDEILLVDEKANVVEGKKGLKPSKESCLHINIFRAREDVDSVIHVHPVYITGFSVKNLTLPMPTASSKLKLKKVPMVDCYDPGSKELADAVYNAVKDAAGHVSAITLAAHGLIAFARGMGNCFDIAELAEETAKVAFISKNLGGD
ncbi:MAG: class II aldolase/adducin family protein [Actinomycetota bacterium]